MFPLAAPSDASFRLIPVGPAIEPSVIFLGDCTNDTSLMFKSDNDPNVGYSSGWHTVSDNPAHSLLLLLQDEDAPDQYPHLHLR